MHKIYQSDGVVSVLDVRPLAEGAAGVVPESATKAISELNTRVISESATKVIPDMTPKVIPESCSRGSQPCKTAKRLGLPTETFGNDGMCAKRLALRAAVSGYDGVCTCVIPESCGRESQPYKTEKTYKKRACATGFTLIELLVVVLIISILAAVALPQYRLAVQKTRTLSLMPLLRSISDAERVFLMENGVYTLSFSDLSMAMPAGGRLSPAGGDNNGDRIVYNGFLCFIRTNESFSRSKYSAYCKDTSAGAPSLEKYFSSEEFICWGRTDVSALSTRVCRHISNRTEADTHTTSGGAGYSFR